MCLDGLRFFYVCATGSDYAAGLIPDVDGDGNKWGVFAVSLDEIIEGGSDRDDWGTGGCAGLGALTVVARVLWASMGIHGTMIQLKQN